MFLAELPMDPPLHPYDPCTAILCNLYRIVKYDLSAAPPRIGNKYKKVKIAPTAFFRFHLAAASLFARLASQIPVPGKVLCTEEKAGQEEHRTPAEVRWQPSVGRAPRRRKGPLWARTPPSRWNRKSLCSPGTPQT